MFSFWNLWFNVLIWWTKWFSCQWFHWGDLMNKVNISKFRVLISRVSQAYMRKETCLIYIQNFFGTFHLYVFTRGNAVILTDPTLLPSLLRQWCYSDYFAGLETLQNSLELQLETPQSYCAVGDVPVTFITCSAIALIWQGGYNVWSLHSWGSKFVVFTSVQL